MKRFSLLVIGLIVLAATSTIAVPNPRTEGVPAFPGILANARYVYVASYDGRADLQKICLQCTTPARGQLAIFSGASWDAMVSRQAKHLWSRNLKRDSRACRVTSKTAYSALACNESVMMSVGQSVASSNPTLNR